MNSSITVKINPRYVDFAGSASLAETIGRRVVALVKRVFSQAPTTGVDNVQHLLALADAYAETQPSYAADLRAAALAYDAKAGRRID